MKRDVYVALACLALGYVMGWFARRWHLRAALRRRLKFLKMIPAIAVLWAAVEVSRLSAQVAVAPDSLITLPQASDLLGEWTPEKRAFCIERAADFRTLMVIVSIVPADTTQRPPCRAEDGALLPVLATGPTCPPSDYNPAPYPFLVVRCSPKRYTLNRAR